MAALQALTSVTSKLATAQSQINTGLRVSEAAHNAAYWSIATTMRSDNQTVATVQDAIGLGAARADMAYAGLTAVIGVLSDFNAKIVLARGETANRDKIQTELDQMKKQIVGIATSATFAGANWLSTGHPDNLMDLSVYKTEIVSSYVRSPQGAITVGTTGVNLIATSLFNVGGGGALQADPRSLGNIGGLRGQSMDFAAPHGSEDYGFTGPVTFGDDDVIRFTLTVDKSAYSAGQSYDVVIDKGVIDAVLGTDHIDDTYQMARVMQEAFDRAGAPVSSRYSNNPSYNVFGISSRELADPLGSSISITLIETLAGGKAMGMEEPPVLDYDNAYASAAFGFAGPFRVHNDVTFSFEISVDRDNPVRITVDRSVVDTVLGTTDGKISDAAQFAAVLDHVLDGKGLRATSGGGQVNILVDQSIYPQSGSRSSIELRDVTDSIGTLPNFDLQDVDVTNPAADLENYLSGLAGMLSKVTTAASELGAIKTRLALQADFSRSLSDAIDRGVGQLVDADMNKASTRLNALQAQQQLAIQSLQIANSNPQSILELLR
jgi:flagellin